ncbi:MAG: imidazole glycerol phosphate synthase subunit HisH [Ignavibacteriae bacterium HGW-Ignavibacteriae-3]|nr:MAG: imidazole glycerol phosphate synthase subunit HisH [Ignavibacteriae bacterium HGW-Ignavibacteriae-3]
MIVLIDYGAGNTASIANVLDDLNCEYVISQTEKDVCNSDKIIFPGVGEAQFAVKKLHMLNLFNLLRLLKKPMLGICLGMQLMCEKSKEGNVAGLGIFSLGTEKFDETIVKVPHMGWNHVKHDGASKLFEGIKNNEYFYFANSYFVPVNEFTTSFSNYQTDFSSSMEKENFYGVQFHPEKSGPAGIQLIKNFVELC